MKMPEKLKNILNNQRGSVLVLVAVGMTVLLGAAALVADVGVNYVTQARLSVAADAAALAGGTLFDEGRDAVMLAAVETAEKNGVPAEQVFVEVDDNARGVTVRTQAPVQLFFGRIFGMEGGAMEQRARAARTRPIAFYGVFPLGVEEGIEFDYHTKVNLFSDDLLGSGNWGALAFQDENGDYQTGASIWREHLKLGYDGVVEIDDWADASGGVSMGPIRDGINYRFAEAAKDHVCTKDNCPTGCPRILILPIYQEVLDNNQNKTGEVIIVDFAAFWVSEMLGQGANTEVWGYFVRPHVFPAASEEGESAYGLTALKLVK
ncbi:pilus assembly protein TadG-related protein [Dethiobacter alkaliphilus]|uniref:Flp pilus assembly protein TadD n=1 Tax=Dethiobacter alkaliphilus AHT 1 TaxID=555088 RepID=C0GKL1_DETAL|nr:pilus assembly protein TadG-related protein [Dethiobacter alkaliphilus]EEG76103.1 flp pilus assembly protein TadD [Dethiobacter alkaliphilus AHT 1]